MSYHGYMHKVAKKRYWQVYDGYSIHVGTDEIGNWSIALMENKPLAPEIVGMLIGRAKVVSVPALCEHCRKPIKIGDEVKDTDKNLMDSRYTRILHDACFEEIKK